MSWSINSPRHCLPLRRRTTVADLDLVLDLGRHTPRHTAEHNIRNCIDNAHDRIISFAIDANVETSKTECEDLKAVTAPDQTDVILVQAEIILLPDYVGRGTDRRSGAHARFEAHARHGASPLAHATRLQAAASAKVPLAALVVGPSRTGSNVVEHLVAHVDLRTAKAGHGTHPAAGLAAGRLTHGNVVLVRIVGELTHGASVLARHLIL